MKMKFVTAIYTLLLLFTISSSFANPVYTEKDTSFTVTRENSTFTIKLSSNPSTGYNWKLHDFDKNMLILKEHNFVKTSDKIGAPGFETWTFEATEEAFTYVLSNIPHYRQTVLVFDYARHGEKGVKSFSKVYQQFDITFE